MPSRGKVRNTHIGAQIKNLHSSLLDIMGAINRSARGEVLIKQAAIPLDRALFPLLVVIDKLGPIGVVDLADQIGRDYTTVSRQVAKLESVDLVERKADAKDRRIRVTAIAPKGKAMTLAVDAARERLGRRIFKTWDAHDIAELVRLMRKFADAIKGGPSE